MWLETGERRFVREGRGGWEVLGGWMGRWDDGIVEGRGVVVGTGEWGEL